MSDEKITEKQMKELKEEALQYIIPHFASNTELAKGPKIFTRGEGCYVYDIEGRRFLDTFATLLTTVCGHNRPEIAKAVQEQMSQLEFFPNYVDTFTIPLIKLAKKLAKITPGELSVSFFVNSGSEANETAFKMARQYHLEKGERQRYKIIGRRYSYHGTTLGGVSATGIPWFWEYFEPLLPGFIFAPEARSPDNELNCLKAMKEIVEYEGPKSIATVIMDPLPGSNTGYPLPPDGYLKGVRDLCDKYGILLIFDEVQTGFGKTGKWFACEHWDVVPDIMTIGKGFTGGYIPLAATITTPKVYEVFKKPGSEFRSGSTYGGHTTACAATLANIEIIEKENLVQKAASMGKYLRKELEKLYKYPIVGNVQGIGMLLAVELLANRETKEPLDPKLAVGSWVRDWCWENGMILRNNGDILVIAPSLILSKDEADEMLVKLDQAISEAVKYSKF